jgi:hypothetical protein
MTTNFVCIGNRIINLALVTCVHLDGKNYKDEPVVAVGFDKDTEVWFAGNDHDTAKAFFLSISKEVTR